MPFELLEQNIVSAILEIVRRTARQRKWQPSTWAKELAAYAGAMRTSPTRQSHRSPTQRPRVERSGEDGEASGARDGPRPTGADYIRPVHQRGEGFETVLPRAALFLSMMWAMASRAGDISGLRQKDVTLATSVRPDGTVAVGVEQKVGKGTRFRGTYWPASTLLQEEAAELRRAMSLVSPNQRLFRDHEILKDHIRKALHRENRASALSSVRKVCPAPCTARRERGDLMRLMGHKRVETLYRYLGHGLPVTQEAVAAQDAAARVHRPPPSTSATRLLRKAVGSGPQPAVL
eukprot:gene3681-biopygen2213